MNSAHTVRSSAIRRCSVIAFGLPALLLLCVAGSVHGQNDTTADAEPVQVQILFRQDDGKVVPIENLGFPPERIEQVLQWLTTQQSVPGYDTIMAASGTVHQSRAEIHVELKIEVHADDWVRVPVGFQSWTVTDFQHAPDQPGFESRFAGNASGRREWFLKGKGSHTLSMDLIAEVRDQKADRQRLKLSMPNAVTSSLKLTFDHPVQNVRGNTGNRGPVESRGDETIATFYGLQQETEITWESAATASDQSMVISAPEPAAMTLDLTTSTAVLRCTQAVTITDGAIDHLLVRLPPGYSEAAITGTDDSGNQIVQSDDMTAADGASTARIVFNRPVRRRIELQFELQHAKTATQPSDEEVIFVSVPDIDGISEQTATVNISIPRGLEVKISPGLQTRRVRVESQPNLRSEEATAFELLSTDARLQLNVREPEARFTVRPQLRFSTDEKNLLLLARFPINVSPGSLDELLVSWQRFSEDGWQIDPGSIYLTEDDDKRSQLSHNFPDENSIHLPLDNFQSGRFTVEFQAFRSLIPSTEGAAAGAFYLPDVVASTSLSTTLSLVESDTYSLSLTRATDGSSFDMASSRTLVTPQDSSRVTSWQVRDSGSLVRVQESRQTQEISSKAVVALNAERGSIQVHTEISINVKHRDLRELRFTAADGIIPTLKLGGQPEPLPTVKLDGDEFVWQLPEAIRGEHTASLSYLCTPDPTAVEVRLPLVLPASGLESLIVGTEIPQVIDVVHDENIRPVYQERFEAAWYSDEPLTELLLSIPQALRHHQPSLPSICLVETHIGPVNVSTTTTAVYESRPRNVLFSVPANAGILARVNDVQVEAPKIELGELDSREIRRVFIPADMQEGSVAISLTCQTPRGPHHHLLSRETIECPRIVRPPEWLTTVWLIQTLDHDRLVSLDSRQHSLVAPSVTDTVLLSPADRVSRSIDTILSGMPDSVRAQFEERLDQSAVTSRASLVFVGGPQLQSGPVMIYSRSMGWVIAAGLGILIYAGLVSFRQHLKLIAIVGIPLCVLAWGLLPQQTLALMFPLLPAVVVAFGAWIIRQLLKPSQLRRRSRHRRPTAFSATSRSQQRSSVADPLRAPAPVSGAEPAVQ